MGKLCSRVRAVNNEVDSQVLCQDSKMLKTAFQVKVVDL